MGNPNISFFDFLGRFENDDVYEDLMVALFKRQDLMTKTAKLKNLAGIVERLQDEANRQQEYMLEIFDSMEAAGLHNILKKWYIRDNRILRRRHQLHFDLPEGVD